MAAGRFPAVMYLFNTDLNPFILWSRLCNKGARRVVCAPDLFNKDLHQDRGVAGRVILRCGLI